MMSLGQLALEFIQGAAIGATCFAHFSTGMATLGWVFHSAMAGVGQYKGKSAALTSMYAGLAAGVLMAWFLSAD